MAGITDKELKAMSQEERAKALGMTSENLSGRSMFIEFDSDADENLVLRKKNCILKIFCENIIIRIGEKIYLQKQLITFQAV